MFISFHDFDAFVYHHRYSLLIAYYTLYSPFVYHHRYSLLIAHYTLYSPFVYHHSRPLELFEAITTAIAKLDDIVAMYSRCLTKVEHILHYTHTPYSHTILTHYTHPRWGTSRAV
jgi:hypothetical protein